MNTVRIFGFALFLLIPGAGLAQAAVATDCTLYVAANGSDSNSGTSSTAPKTLTSASSASQPGSVICLKGGTYNISSTFRVARSGTASAWIVYKAYGDSDVNIVWTGGGNSSDLFWMSSGTQYIEMRGLKFDGRNGAAYAFKCNSAYHLRFVGNTISNMSSGGIGSVLCDYITADSNKISHNGYNQGWASGITLNSNQWSDSYAGFHNIVINNIISGTFDGSSYHTDGNGIIMDLSNRSYDPSTANSPPALIANNVVYQNGGRCIETYVTTNIWVVNNTCYKNALDLTQGSGEITANNSKNNYFVNNIATSWNNRQPYAQYNTNQNMVYYKNLRYGGNNSFTYSDPAQFINADPLFVNPITLNAAADGQYATALPADQLGDRLSIQAGSPAIDKGIDPSTIPGIPAEIKAGLQQYLARDITGKARPQGIGFDLGAYESGGSITSAPAPPTNIRIVWQ